MKTALLVFVISIAFAQWELETVDASLACAMYSCKPDKVTFADESVCLQIFDYNYYLRPCSKGYYCDVSGTTNGRAYCIYDSDVGVPNERYNGEKCTYDYDCMSSYCNSGVCSRYTEGDICELDSDCNAGQYCYYNTTTTENYCIDVLKTGSFGCNLDTECQSSSGCLVNSLRTPSKNKCVTYFSLPDYTPLLSCPSDGQRNYLCSSGYCWGNTTNSYCIPAPVTAQTLPLACNSDSVCTSTADKQLQVSFGKICSCGYNPKGQSFCNLFEGDTPYKNYLNLLEA